MIPKVACKVTNTAENVLCCFPTVLVSETLVAIIYMCICT